MNESKIDLYRGLTTREAQRRIKKYGPNVLKKKKKVSPFKIFLEQFNDFIIWVLIAATLISGFMGEKADAITILIIVIMNAILGFVQEFKTEKSLEALNELSSPTAKVIRDSSVKVINAEELVIGDLVILESGDRIPADCILVEQSSFMVDESLLTGESVGVEKNSNSKNSSIYMGTVVLKGRAKAKVVETGMDTELGKIAEMLDDIQVEKSPLKEKLSYLGKVLVVLCIIICVIVTLTGIWRGQDKYEMFLLGVSLAVAAIPEGLPAIVTIVLAMGVQRMIKENAIIRKLPAVETLGAVNIICSDKTGTLIQNKMTVIKFYTNNEIQDIDKLNIEDNIHKMLLENLVLCNDATFSKDSSTGDPTEIALLEAGAKYNIVKNNIENEHKRIDEIPFDSDRKLMTTVNNFDDKNYVMTKGAIDNLLKISTNAYINGEIVPLTDEIKENIMDASNEMSKNALRVLGAAYKTLEDTNYNKENLEMDLTFIGLVGMIDPPRESVKGSIFECKNSGIKTIMITGDHKVTAFAIAKELGIAEDESQAIFGYELDDMPDSELSSKIENLRVFARVSPEHKVKIVKALKSKGNIVSMTGDGVNDAPSLKAADIGVAMGITGTDVAKGASDMVLTDDNFSTIVSAIKEGRNIYNNIKKSIVFLLSCNLGEILALFIGILLGWPAPLRPIHLLWVNLITDSLPALSLGIDPGDPDIMDEDPRDPKESLFAGGAGISLILNGLLIGVLTLVAFEVGRIRYSDSLIHAQTMAFVVLSVSQLFHSFNMRHPKKSIFQLGLFTNKYLFASVIFGIFLQDMVITIPFLASIFKVFDLTIQDWIFVCALSIIPLIINEIVKFFKRLKDK